MSTLGDAADVNPVIKFLPHTLHVRGRNVLPFGVTIPAAVLQSLEILEGLIILYNPVSKTLHSCVIHN
jgi:hypothetical protein